MAHILYLWNDLSLFCKDKFRVERIWKKFGKYLNSENRKTKEQRWYCFGTGIVDEWINDFSFNEDTFLICLGTRPAICLNRKGVNKYLHIKPQRIRTENGATGHIEITPIEKQLLEEGCKKANQKIYIIEDAIVNGKTIQFLLNQIEKVGFRGEVVVKVLFGNKEVICGFQDKYPFDVTFIIKEWMQGTPIKESTLICIYDLLYGLISEGTYYYERIDLLERFIPNSKGKLYFLIKECREL